MEEDVGLAEAPAREKGRPTKEEGQVGAPNVEELVGATRAEERGHEPVARRAGARLARVAVRHQRLAASGAVAVPDDKSGGVQRGVWGCPKVTPVVRHHELGDLQLPRLWTPAPIRPVVESVVGL